MAIFASFNRRKKSRSVATSFRSSDRKKRLTGKSPFIIKEAYSALRAQLAFFGRLEKQPVYVICSALAGSGKTVTAVNIGTSFAMTGSRVLLIDADMRNPNVHKYFRVYSETGLSEYLAGITDEVAPLHTDVEGLDVLPAGAIPPNPAELLAGGNRFEELITRARENYDYIFVDTPPLGMVVDAAIISDWVDGYLMVVRSNFGRREEVRYALDVLEQKNAPISGFVLNSISSRVNKKYNSTYRHGMGYKYDYHKG